MSKQMNTRAAYATIAAMALTVGLAAAAYASSDKDKDVDRRAAQEATVALATDASSELALEEILARLRTAGYSDFREIERESGRYEVEGRHPEGHHVELYVDARTGEVIKEERDD